MFSNTLIAGIGLLILCFLALIPSVLLIIRLSNFCDAISDFKTYGFAIIDIETMIESDEYDDLVKAVGICNFILGNYFTIKIIDTVIGYKRWGLL